MNAQILTKDLGGRWQNGKGQAPCPICQPEGRKDQNALSIGERDGKLLLYCFKSRCSFAEITQAINLPLQEIPSDQDANRQAERKQTKYRAAKLAQAQALWNEAAPIAGTLAEAYLRGRGITANLPECLRFAPSAYHAPSQSLCCAMIAKVEPTGGIHRTYFDKQGVRLPGSSKMMMGPCSGGAVRLSDEVSSLVVCEGIETGLSLLSGLLTSPASVWAALSTSGMKSLELPAQPGNLTVATDGDEPGIQAGNTLANRAIAKGWSVRLLPAPNGRDWNDVLTASGAQL